MEELRESVGFEKSYLSSLIKMLGIAYIGNFLQESAEMPGIRQQPDRLSCFAGFDLLCTEFSGTYGSSGNNPEVFCMSLFIKKTGILLCIFLLFFSERNTVRAEPEKAEGKEKPRRYREIFLWSLT